MPHPRSALEDEHTPMLASSSTLLGISSHQRREPAPPSSAAVWTVLRFLCGGIYAPDASTYAPIAELLNAEAGEEQDRLTERWRDNKLSELSFVGVVVGLRVW